MKKNRVAKDKAGLVRMERSERVREALMLFDEGIAKKSWNNVMDALEVLEAAKAVMDSIEFREALFDHDGSKSGSYRNPLVRLILNFADRPWVERVLGRFAKLSPIALSAPDEEYRVAPFEAALGTVESSKKSPLRPHILIALMDFWDRFRDGGMPLNLRALYKMQAEDRSVLAALVPSMIARGLSNEIGFAGRSNFMVAATFLPPAALTAMLTSGADPFKTDKLGRNAFAYAAGGPNPENLEALVEAVAGRGAPGADEELREETVRRVFSTPDALGMTPTSRLFDRAFAIRETQDGRPSFSKRHLDAAFRMLKLSWVDHRTGTTPLQVFASKVPFFPQIAELQMTLDILIWSGADLALRDREERLPVGSALESWRRVEDARENGHYERSSERMDVDVIHSMMTDTLRVCGPQVLKTPFSNHDAATLGDRYTEFLELARPSVPKEQVDAMQREFEKLAERKWTEPSL